jgi:hypothetical protein
MKKGEGEENSDKKVRNRISSFTRSLQAAICSRAHCLIILECEIKEEPHFINEQSRQLGFLAAGFGVFSHQYSTISTYFGSLSWS